MVQCFTMSKIMVMNVRQLIECPPPPLPYSAMADRLMGTLFVALFHCYVWSLRTAKDH